MSKDDIATLQDALDSWPDPPTASAKRELSDACSRVLDALPGLSTQRTGWMDIAALVRQVLITARITYGGRPTLTVPTGEPWPSLSQWEQVCCSVTSAGGGRRRIDAFDWAPPSSLLDDGIGTDSAVAQVAAAYRDVEPAFGNALEADPFWREAHGYTEYRGEPQRQAARAAVLNDAGSVIIALPTGRGKTAVAWSKTLLSATGVTIVVVPTVVLAVDMERRTREASRERAADGRAALSPFDRYAYVGNLSPDIKRSLREAVRSGAQRLLYTSPEALVSSLSFAVLDCARSGGLQQMVIDEAHLVDQWGTDFRPEFQTMPGLLREAYDLAPADRKPSVVLLSATMAQRSIDLLARLFSMGDRPVDLVWGSEVRLEPAFFFGEHTAEESRTQAVTDAVARLPRPMIVYTSTVEDAESWTLRLREAGLGRVATITGKSNDQTRRGVMDRWRGDPTAPKPTELDVVVGTSAFGLGLDMPNVRTVLHACLPETLDRYYQEVGRAGRDGRPSVAYLCRGPHDLRIAEALNDVSMIGDDLGWKRWRSMMQMAEPVADRCYRTKKNALPPYLDVGYKRSELWNVRTLTLMAQAQVIRMRVPRFTADPAQTSEEQEAARAAFYDEIETLTEFELLDGQLQSQGPWQKALAEVRGTVRAAQEASLQNLRGLLAGRECVGRAIARHYSVQFQGGRLLTHPACRGCPACRRSPERSPGVLPPEPCPAIPNRLRPDPLENWRGQDPFLFIRVGAGEDVGPLLVRLAQRNARVFDIGATEASKLQREVRVPIIRDDPASTTPLIEFYDGLVVVVLRSSELPDSVRRRIELRQLTYLIGPEDLVDPDRPGNLLRDTRKSIAATAALGSL